MFQGVKKKLVAWEGITAGCFTTVMLIVIFRILFYRCEKVFDIITFETDGRWTRGRTVDLQRKGGFVFKSDMGER